MRKNNMFGIVIKEEWKLDRKKFLIILGAVFVVNLSIIAFLEYAFKKGAKVNDAFDISEFIPFVLAMQVFLVMLLPVILTDKLIKGIFKNDSSFLYKMIPVKGFELFGGKLIVDLIEFLSSSILVFLASLVCGTQISMIATKSQGNEPQRFVDTFKGFAGAIIHHFKWEGFSLILTFALFMCLLCALVILVSVLRHSFSVNLNSKLVGAIGYILCFVIIFAIGHHIKSNVITIIVLAVLTAGTFIANCVLYEKRVSV